MARARRPLMAGNWKMNGLRADGVALARAVAGLVKRVGWADRDILVCPPATLLTAVAEAVAGSGVAVGGQDCHASAKGAHTGDIAAEMLRDAGASHVIVGHSERRRPELKRASSRVGAETADLRKHEVGAHRATALRCGMLGRTCCRH